MHNLQIGKRLHYYQGRLIVFPVNVRLLLEAMIAPPSTMIPHALLCVNSVLPARVISGLLTTSAVAGLPWKEQLTSSVRCVDCKSRTAYRGAEGRPATVTAYLKSLLQEVKCKK